VTPLPLPRLDRVLARSSELATRGIVMSPPSSYALPEKAVQFGTGAFLRGFVDYFIDEANQEGRFGGRVVAVGSTGSSRDDALRRQDGLFTVALEHDGEHGSVREYRVVSALSRALSARNQWDEVLALARSPELELVFSNTTEVGIRLDENDRPGTDAPASFPGKLTRFLLERARAFAYARDRGVVVLPCELIDDNGTRLREIVLALASRWKLEPEFVRWIETAVPFCNTLVDRIVPGTPTGANAERLRRILGYEDELLLTCEPYRLFAIEWPSGPFDALRGRLRFLPLDRGGIVTDDVGPYRERKVRLLNGSHTILAPIGLLLGCETVRDAVRHPALGQLVRRAMLDEIAPMVDAEGAEQFAEDVLERFENPFIRHALLDITLQGTMKLRVRVVPSLIRHVERAGRVPSSIAFGLAAFLFFMRGDLHDARASGGLSMPADDSAPALRTLWTHHGETDQIGRLVWLACGDQSLWGADLRAVPGVCEAVTDHLWRICTDGIRSALDHQLASSESSRVAYSSTAFGT
jgi:tagaturonate reductase